VYYNSSYGWLNCTNEDDSPFLYNECNASNCGTEYGASSYTYQNFIPSAYNATYTLVNPPVTLPSGIFYPTEANSSGCLPNSVTFMNYGSNLIANYSFSNSSLQNPFCQYTASTNGYVNPIPANGSAFSYLSQSSTLQYYDPNFGFTFMILSNASVLMDQQILGLCQYLSPYNANTWFNCSVNPSQPWNIFGPCDAGNCLGNDIQQNTVFQWTFFNQTEALVNLTLPTTPIPHGSYSVAYSPSCGCIPNIVQFSGGSSSNIEVFYNFYGANSSSFCNYAYSKNGMVNPMQGNPASILTQTSKFQYVDLNFDIYYTVLNSSTLIVEETSFGWCEYSNDGVNWIACEVNTSSPWSIYGPCSVSNCIGEYVSYGSQFNWAVASQPTCFFYLTNNQGSDHIYTE
jgi:hypothetical protein